MKNKPLIKNVFLVIWLGLFVVFFVYLMRIVGDSNKVSSDLNLFQKVFESFKIIAKSLEAWARDLGVIGIFLLAVAYIVRPFVFFPASILAAVCGAVYGPYLGSLFAILFENISANVAFFAARFELSKPNESKYHFIQKLNEETKLHGFYYIFMLRAVYFPFDVVNFGAGLTKIKWKHYFWGTFLGVLPGILGFVLLGSTAKSGKLTLVVSLGLLLLSIVIGYVAKRTKLGEKIHQLHKNSN